MLTNNRIKYTSLPLKDKERNQYCQLIGQLNWITNMAKPEFSFEVCYAGTVVNSATISDITNLSKVLKHIMFEKSYIKFPGLKGHYKTVHPPTPTETIFPPTPTNPK